MSAREWAPGTVADATVSPGLRVRALKVPEGWRWVTDDGRDGFSTDDSPSFRDVRPLVVLDPKPKGSSHGWAYWLRKVADTHEAHSTHLSAERGVIRQLADQIEEQTRDPKPAEPTGLGAVVETADGEQFIRSDLGWHPVGYLSARYWPDLDVARVLSVGVGRAPEAGEGA